MQIAGQALNSGRRVWSVFAAGNSCKHYIWVRLMTTKASNRAAVHGVKLPIPDIVDKEEIEREIQKGKEEKEAKSKEIEKKLDSELNNSSNSDQGICK